MKTSAMITMAGMLASGALAATKSDSYTVVVCIEDGDHEGKEFSHSFKIMSADETTQTNGQSFFSDLRRVTGIDQPENTSDLHDIPLVAIVGPMGRIEYARA